MKVVITGASGQLGTDLRNILLKESGIKIYPFSKSELDITNQVLVKSLFETVKPNIILHCAANTNVDGCELEQVLAYKVNAYGTRNIAVEAERYQARLIYISTDYVFDGNADSPYHEFSPTNPLSVYGASKLAGEDMVKHFCKRHFIVRTSWLYGLSGNNFVKNILKLAQNNNSLKVVDDQIGCPTFTFDLAVFLVDLMNSEAYGIYHATNTGYCSWFEFAGAILDSYGIKEKLVQPIKSEELNRPAPRPHYSVLTSISIRSNGMSNLPTWQDGLYRFIKDLEKYE